METVTDLSAAAPARARYGWRERAIAYAQLTKLHQFGVFLSVPLVWSLLPSSLATDAQSLAILALALVTVVGVRTAESALDDVAGLRDGIDAATYAGEGDAHRKRSEKPLLDGRLTERQAVRYAQAAAGTGALAFLAAFAIAGFDPVWVPLAAVAAALLVIGYSWGPKLSYLGAHDLVVTVGVSFTVFATYGMIADDLPWLVVVQGLTLGLWLTVPMTYANLADREADGRAGRNTLAVRLSPASFERYTVGVFLVSWVPFVTGVATGTLEWCVTLLVLPCLALQLAAFGQGLRGDRPLLARRNCHRAYRLGWLGLVVANLVVVG